MTDFDFSAFAPENDDSFKADLDTLRTDVKEALELKEIIDQLEDELKEIKSRYRHITEGRIPYAMKEMGIPEFKFDDKTKVSIKDSITGSLQRATDLEFAKNFIIDHDAADLLKTEVSTTFGKGSHNEALSLAAELREKGYEVQAEETIHASTYAAFGRELLREHNHKLENGMDSEEPPFEKLGLFYIRKAEIKKAK